MANNASGKMEKAFTVIEGIQRGCVWLFWNLFLLGFCLWGVYAGYVSWKLENEGETTTGRVVRLVEKDGPDGCCVYEPIIEFTATGRTYEFDTDSASYPPAYEVGEEVSVIYDPDNPATAQVNKWTERWLFPVLIIPAMLITAAALNILFFRAWRRGEDL